MVKAKVIQFRRGRHTIHQRHFILDVGASTRSDAEKFVGKTAEWTSPGKMKKVIKGKISSAHGNSGLVRAIFERGLPGQAIGTDCEVRS